MIEILFVCFYLAIAVVFYGINFAYWQRNWPTIAKQYYKIDIFHSILCALFWPFSWICLVFSSKPLQGLKFW